MRASIIHWLTAGVLRALEAMTPPQQGLAVALATALLSGVSIYLNAIAARALPDPFVFTTLKNVAVALALSVLLGGVRLAPRLRALTRGQWGSLVALGLVGGSVPFLLFFYGLSQASAPSAAFIHKTLFLWVALLAVPLLGERVGRVQVVALAVLAGANLTLLGWPGRWALSVAELCTLAATLLWAVEAVIARRALRRTDAALTAWARMAFGGAAMLAFLAATGRAGSVAALSAEQWGWVAVTAVLLVGYVSGYYRALSLAPASLATAVLVAGSLVTAALYAVIDARRYGVGEVVGFALVLVAVAGLVAAAARSAGAPTPALAPEVPRDRR